MRIQDGILFLLGILPTAYLEDAQYFMSPCVGESLQLSCDFGSTIALTRPGMAAQLCESNRTCCGNVDCFYKMLSIHREELYKTCSGKRECDYTVPLSPTQGSDCPGYDAQISLALINYQCIKDGTTVPFCGGTRTGDKHYLHYRKSDGKLAASNHADDISCSCVVENTNGQGVVISAVDLRLSAVTNGYKECFSVTVTENCNTTHIWCAEDFLADNSEITRTSSKTVINIDTHEGYGPEAIWLEVKGSSPGDVIDVKCAPRDQYSDLPCPRRTSSGGDRRRSRISTTGSEVDRSNVPDISVQKTTPSRTHRTGETVIVQSSNIGIIAGGASAGLLFVWCCVATVLVVRDKINSRGSGSKRNGDNNSVDGEVYVINALDRAVSEEQQQESLMREIQSYWYTELDMAATEGNSGSCVSSPTNCTEETHDQYDIPENPNKRSSGNSYTVNGCLYTCVDKSGNDSKTNSGNYDSVETVDPRNTDSSHDYFVLHSNRGSGEPKILEGSQHNERDDKPSDKETNYPDVVINARTLSSRENENASVGYDSMPSLEKKQGNVNGLGYSRVLTSSNSTEDSDGYTHMRANGELNNHRISSTYENEVLRAQECGGLMTPD